MKRINVNEQVNVTALGFRKDLASYPKRMEYQGNTYNFVDSGIRCLIRRGSVIAEVLTLTDGIANYLLKTDNRNGNWTLLGIVC
jgi:hypothetical protein